MKPVDLSGLDFSEEDVFEGARALDPVGPGVEGKPHLRSIPTKQMLYRLSLKVICKIVLFAKRSSLFWQIVIVFVNCHPVK